MMRLIFHTGPRAGREVNTGAPLVRLGRDPQQNDIVIEDPQISARHCILTRSPRGTYVLEDLGSSNGTFVNDKPVASVGVHTAVYLSTGDRFRLGGTEIEVSEGLPRLMIVRGAKVGRDLPIGEEAITIGRAPDNVLDFEDPDVSVYHAAILCLPTGYVLQDNGSTNGTFVNHNRIDRHFLEDGDTIELGDNELRFLIDEALHPAEEKGIRSLEGGEQALANLVFVSGPHAGVAVPIGAGGQVTFGRRGDCTFPVSDLQVSGFHCAVTHDVTEHKVTDLQSTNGTFVNGERLSGTTTLHPGDLVEFGQCVAEYRLAGGVTVSGDGATAMTTVMADGAYLVTSQPKFIINGHVESTDRIQIGRSPSSHLRLEGDGISALHAEIVWEDGFYVEDKSRYGTYVGDKRVVKEKLQTGHVLRAGDHLIEVQVRGERCTLDVIDAATALAAIEIARENEFKLNQAVPDEANTGGIDSAYKTVFKLELPDTEAMVRERKAKFKKGAPAWRPSTDVKSEWFGKLAVISAVAASIAIGGFLYATQRAEALINHPLSEPHSSKLFAIQIEENELDGGCAACHESGAGVPDAKCARCHDGFDEAVRPPWRKTGHTPADGQERQVPGTCVTCHTEHRGAPRLTESGAPQILGALSSCSQSQCHPNQHTEAGLRDGPPPPIVIEAGALKLERSQEQLHADHAVVVKGDEEIAVGCTACHAQKDAKTGELSESSLAGWSCFNCHSAGDDISTKCVSCHKDEHRGVAHERLPDGDPLMTQVVPAPSIGTSLIKGGAFALAAFLPLLGIAVLRRLRRQKRSERVVEELQEIPAEIVKRLIHSINIEKCVGCHMCVQACPASVLELVNHKSTIVNFDACIQCRKCEQACAFDALRMHEADKPPPMVQMPEVDNYYQTRVDGLYLIGQASGCPQVKNASNLGRVAVQHIVQAGYQPGSAGRYGAQYDVVIVGTGPAGLSAAMSCSQFGLSYVILEKQRDFSWTIRSYYHKGKPATSLALYRSRSRISNAGSPSCRGTGRSSPIVAGPTA